MKEMIASVFFDILSYTIGNIIFCIFKNFEFNLIIITARVYKLRLAEVKFFSCLKCVSKFWYIKRTIFLRVEVNMYVITLKEVFF